MLIMVSDKSQQDRLRERKSVMKKMLSLVLAFAMCTTLWTPSLAAEKGNDEAAVAVLVVNGIPFSLTQQEFDKLREDETAELQRYEELTFDLGYAVREPESSISPVYERTSTYKEKNGVDRLVDEMTVEVSPAWDGGEEGTYIMYGESVTIKENLEADISLTAEIKDVIVAALGGKYTKSAQTNAHFNGIPKVPAGKRGKVIFTPMMRVTEGVLTVHTMYNNGERTETYLVSGYIPIKVGSFADGLYSLRYV